MHATAHHSHIHGERNRLLYICDSGANLLAAYSYDALGRRVTATIGATTTRYYYDGGR